MDIRFPRIQVLSEVETWRVTSCGEKLPAHQIWLIAAKARNWFSANRVLPEVETWRVTSCGVSDCIPKVLNHEIALFSRYVFFLIRPKINAVQSSEVSTKFDTVHLVSLFS